MQENAEKIIVCKKIGTRLLGTVQLNLSAKYI